MPGKIKNRVGLRYGKLTVFAFDRADTSPRGQTVTYWHCRCDCGAEKSILGSSLHSGNSKSCGCVWKTNPGSRKHGQSSSYAYNTWRAMKDRCQNPNASAFKTYGGRGITICEAWQTFEGFLADMGERPKGLTLDRIDRDGMYEPSNCRWATARQQAGNLPQARKIEHDGKTYSTVEFAEVMGVHPATLNWRIFRQGQDPHEAAADLKRLAGRPHKPFAEGSCPRT